MQLDRQPGEDRRDRQDRDEVCAVACETGSIIIIIIIIIIIMIMIIYNNNTTRY